MAPYAPPAISSRLSPPSIGVAGGAPCAIAGTTSTMNTNMDNPMF